MTIGLFGGSFNPPHLAHLVVAETVRDQFALDRVLWMPAYLPPHKEAATLVAAEHRLAMTRLATEGNPAFEVSDLEIRRRGASYTVETLRTLNEAYPEAAFSLILGSDSLRDLGTWRAPEEIVERADLIAYERPGAVAPLVEPRFAGHVRFARAPLLQISGTEIRARCRADRSIRYLLPEAVRAYIYAQHLYGAQD